MLALSIALCWVSVQLLMEMRGAGFPLMIVAAVISFQTLWMLLNPFALVFANRFEIRQSWFHQKERFFNDLNGISSRGKGNNMLITYTDGEVEKVGLFGIRESQRAMLEEACSRQIAASAGART